MCHNDIKEYNKPDDDALKSIVELLNNNQDFIVYFGLNKYGYVKRLQVSNSSFLLSFYDNWRCYERFYNSVDSGFEDAVLDVYSFANLLHWRHYGIYHSRPVKDTVIVPYMKRPSIPEMIFKRARLVLDKEAVAFSSVANNAPYFFNPSESDFDYLNKSAQPPTFIFSINCFRKHGDYMSPWRLNGTLSFDELYRSLQMVHNRFPSGFKAQIFKHIDCDSSLEIVCNNDSFDEIPLVYDGNGFGAITPGSLQEAMSTVPCSHGL